MRNISLLVFFFLLSSICLNVFAQGSGQVCFRLINSAVIRIDNKLVPKNEFNNQNCISLPAGEHSIEIWTPKYELLVDTLVVVENKTTVYSKALTKPNEVFLSYKEELDLYKGERSKRIGRYSLLFGTALAATAVAIGSSFKLRKDYQELKMLKEVYQTSLDGGEAFIAFNEYNEKRKVYNKNVLFKGQIPTAIGIGFSFWGIKNYKKDNLNKLEKPIFNAENPWTK